jgi:hypothetical protein
MNKETQKLYGLAVFLIQNIRNDQLLKQLQSEQYIII